MGNILGRDTAKIGARGYDKSVLSNNFTAYLGTLPVEQ